MLAGKDPPRVVRRLGRDSRVIVTGFLPDLQPAFDGAALAACPLVYGAGVQYKIIEAMEQGLAVVATTNAARAFGAIAGAGVLVADDDAEIADRILELLLDPHLRQRVGAVGRRYVREHHDLGRIGAQLLEAYALATGK
jgi:glycosyltransferase involved in cell wall biosynthesis